jgi:hypothetical protein
VSSVASRRARVHALLTRAASHKLLRAGADLAIEPVREAYALAHRSPTLQPWAALAAYRLAHLLMRDPRARTARPILEEADALFAEAAREPSLGPYPRIYRLAVMHRLGASRAQIERTFQEAAHAHDAWVRHQGEAREAPAAAIQTDLFGMLELAGYFLDLERAPLEGRGARPDEPHLREAHWRLVGPEPSLADVSLGEAAALAELESLATVIAAAVVFRLPADRSASAMKVGDAPWELLPHRAARLLACVLRGGAPDARALTLEVMGGDGTPHQTALRQVRHRLADRLRAHGLLREGDEIVVFAPPLPPRLAPGLVVLGAVSDAGYADRE